MMMLVLILMQVGFVFAGPGESGTAWLIPSSQSVSTDSQVSVEVWANTAADSSMAGIRLYSAPALTYSGWSPGLESVDLGFTDTSVSGKVQVAVGSSATTYNKNTDIHLATIVYGAGSSSLRSALDVDIVNMAGVTETTGDTDGDVTISSCTPTTCEAQGSSCGSIADGCEGTIECGTCGDGSTCSSGTCVAATCSDVSKQCCPDEGIDCDAPNECIQGQCDPILNEIRIVLKAETEGYTILQRISHIANALKLFFQRISFG